MGDERPGLTEERARGNGDASFDAAAQRRDELTQIATTLGKRALVARKGKIIDLILDLAAGGDGGGNAEESDSPDTDVTDATVSPDAGDASDDDTDSDDDQPQRQRRCQRRRGQPSRTRQPSSSPTWCDRDNRNGANEQWDGDPIPAEGRLDLRSEGYGFLRVNGYIPSRDDAYVPVSLSGSTACARAT